MDFCVPWVSIGWKDVADIATSLSVVVAAAALVVGVMTIYENARIAALQHMHGVLADFLRVKMDTDQDPNVDPVDRTRFELYCLEQILIWRDDEAKRWVRPSKRARHEEDMAAWKATVAFHAARNKARYVAEIDADPDVYTEAFRKLVKGVTPVGAGAKAPPKPATQRSTAKKS